MLEYTYASTSGVKEYMLGSLFKLLLNEANMYHVFFNGQITNKPKVYCT